ncbi:MAG: alpha/beta fold hydrolase [Rudaea sp.]
MSANPNHFLPSAFPATADLPVAPRARCEIREGVMALPESFLLESGATLANAKLAWRCSGPADAPLIVVLGGISAHRRPCDEEGKGWWQAQCGAGKPLDTDRYRLLGIDWLGGSDDSSGPRTSGLKDFPVVSTADQARALLQLLNRLGVRRVHLLVGASYGGNVAQQLAALLGDRLRRLVLLSAAHKPAQFGLALRHVQRAILELGTDSTQALALARSLAVLGYRTPESLERRFGGTQARAIDSDGVTGWIDHHGQSFVRRFDADAYRCLGRSLDTHEVDPATIRVPTTLFAVRDDLTVPVTLLREYAARASVACELVEIDSLYGHDAFLKEEAAVGALLARALETTP